MKKPRLMAGRRAKMGEKVQSEEARGYKPHLSVHEARPEVRSLADENRLTALVGTLSKDNHLVFDYDSGSGFLYVGARRNGARFGMIARAEEPDTSSFPPSWTLDHVVGAVGEENIVHTAKPVIDRLQPIASVRFLQGVEHKVPYGTRTVKVKKGRITFWPDGMTVEARGRERCFEAQYRLADNQRPTGVSFDHVKRPAWHYPNPKEGKTQ